MLSKRAAPAQQPSLPYFSLFLDALGDLHHPEANPLGKVSLCVAENALSGAAFSSRLSAALSSPPPPGQLGYCDMKGRGGFRCAISRLAEARITRGAPVEPRFLTVGGGCGALIQHLAFLLCDPADCMLLITPTYAMLYNDVNVLAGVAVVDVPVAPGCAVTPAALDAACARAADRGLRPKLLFLINPENPLGIVRPEAELRGALAWARAREGLHVVVDEIYALSVFGGGGGAPFTSAAALLRDGAAPGEARYLGDFVHVLWGFSKDWCASGLRVGVLFSHNVALAGALDNVGYFTAASNPTQDALAEVLRDEEWVEGFLEGNRRALAGAAAAACAALAGAGLPHLAPTAGMFVWVDLRALLPAGGGWAAERELTRSLFEDAGVLLTPGEAMHAPEPGFFRLCFAWHADPRSLEEGLRRLAAFAARKRALEAK